MHTTPVSSAPIFGMHLKKTDPQLIDIIHLYTRGAMLASINAEAVIKSATRALLERGWTPTAINTALNTHTPKYLRTAITL